MFSILISSLQMRVSEAQSVAKLLWAREGQNQACGFQVAVLVLQNLKLLKSHPPNAPSGPQLPEPQQDWGWPRCQPQQFLQGRFALCP